MKMWRAAWVAGALWAGFFGGLGGSVGRAEERDARAEWLELRREIARHDELYFRKAAPVISDAEYDALKARLRELDAVVGETAADAVGDDRAGGTQTWRHGERMLSLAKAHTDEEVVAFAARVTARLARDEVLFRVEPKYDGLAVSLRYEGGKLVRAVTRGDGTEGDDVTENTRQRVRGLVENLAVGGGWDGPDVVELRGELFMTAADFRRINAARSAAGEELLAHPRNAAVGLLRAAVEDEAEAGEVRGRSLSLVVYGWGAWSPGAGRPEALGDFKASVAAWGLPGVAAERVSAADGLNAAALEVHAAGVAAGAPLDGVVIKVERVAEQDELGLATGSPRWAVARKYAPERAATRLAGITWQVGRTGAVTPVAELEPVELAGSTVARATLHNADEIARRDLRIGDRVWVEKAGEIIPAIAGVDKAARTGAEPPYGIPDTCPGCGGGLARAEGAAALRCEERACAAQVARRLQHFASAGALDIAGLGPAVIEAATRVGLVRQPADFYRLAAQDWAGLPGVGARTAEKLVAAVAASRATARGDGARLLVGLGLPGVGETAARRVAARTEGLAAVLALDAAGWGERAGLGEARARELEAFLRRGDVRAELIALAEAGVGTSWGKGGADAGVLSGQVIVVTGTLERWTRAEVTERLKAAGAEVEDDVTRRTTLLVAGAEAGSKLARARARGVEVIGEKELVRRLGDGR